MFANKCLYFLLSFFPCQPNDYTLSLWPCQWVIQRYTNFNLVTMETNSTSFRLVMKCKSLWPIMVLFQISLYNILLDLLTVRKCNKNVCKCNKKKLSHWLYKAHVIATDWPSDLDKLGHNHWLSLYISTMSRCIAIISLVSLASESSHDIYSIKIWTRSYNMAFDF